MRTIAKVSNLNLELQYLSYADGIGMDTDYKREISIKSNNELVYHQQYSQDSCWSEINGERVPETELWQDRAIFDRIIDFYKYPSKTNVPLIIFIKTIDQNWLAGASSQLSQALQLE